MVHSALERVVGTHLDHTAMAELLRKYPTPEKLRKASRAQATGPPGKNAPQDGKDCGGVHRLGKQTVTVAGTGAAGIVLPRLASMLMQLRTSRQEVQAQVDAQVKALVEAHPLHHALASMPSVGVRTEARIITETDGKDIQVPATPPPTPAPPGHLPLRDLDPRRPPPPTTATRHSNTRSSSARSPP